MAIYDNDVLLRNFTKGLYYPENKVTHDDPTFLGFTLMFDWENSKLFKGANQVQELVQDRDELAAVTVPTESALGYLKGVGDVGRFNYLKSFIDELFYINTHKGYYWQSIEGMDAIWEGSHNFKTLPIGSEWEFTIKTLESVDMRIFGLMELYRKASHDWAYLRRILPSNLQRFNMTVYVNEIRDFQKLNQAAILAIQETGSSETPAVDAFPLIEGEGHGVIIKLDGCKFVPTSGGELLNSFTNAGGGEAAANSIKVVSKGASFEAVLPWFYEKTSNSPTVSQFTFDKGTLAQRVQARVESMLEKAARDYVNKQKSDLRYKVNDLIRDNVPGGLFGTIQELQRGNFINAMRALLGSPNLGTVYSDVRDFDSNGQIADVYPESFNPQESRPVNNLGEVEDYRYNPSQSRPVQDLGEVSDYRFNSSESKNKVNLGEVDDYTFSTQQSSRKINIGNIYPNGGDPNQ